MKTKKKWGLIIATFLAALGIVLMSQTAFAASKYPKLTGANYPTGTLRAGTPFSIRGVITSPTTIKAVRVGVFRDKKGKNAVTARTARPYATRYNIGALDPYVYFDRLAAGSYYYIVAAQNSASSRILLRKAFKVSGGSATSGYPKITGANYPTSIRRGGVFSIRGTISSGSKLTNVTVGVFTSSNATGVKTGRSVNPNSTTYNVANMDSYIQFNILPAGRYYYIVKATNANGTKILVRKRFTVS